MSCYWNFNCKNITGVELEDSGGYDNYNNSHWEARILLGEYMNSEVHTPEQEISGFTLALLEDSGWYKVNYYTGGLMRFGKHQGCEFLYEDCEVNDNSKNKFKNDLFAVSVIQDLHKTTCSSGRQSRSYVITNSNNYIRKVILPSDLKTIGQFAFCECYNLQEVVFNDKNKEFHFKLGDNNKDDIEFKKFEFKPTSRKDHFEFIMKGITNKDKIFEIGRKVFPLNDVQSSEEYLVQIEVPEIEDEEKIAAYINAKIILYWNDISYEQRKKNMEIKINKLNVAITKAEEYLRKLKEIYGENTKTKNKKQVHKKKSYIVEFNNTKEVLLNFKLFLLML